ncbi:hypothetical protein [Desulforhopalus sp. 52FAK]
MSLIKCCLYTTIFYCSLLPLSAQAESWDVEAQLYLMGTSIDGDAAIGRAQGVDVNVDFNTILENLDLAGMVHFEAIHASRWGIALDYSFMDLSADLTGPKGGVADAGVRQGVLQVDLLYRMPIHKGNIDWITGVRWWDNDIDLTVDTTVLPGSVHASVEEDWIDLFIGARWITHINDSLDFMLRGDIGGFGLESELTGQLYGNVRWNLNDSWAIDIGYKAVWVDYESGNKGRPGYFVYDTVTHGPMLGIIYKF